MKGYLHPRMLPYETEATHYVLQSTVPELTTEGPARIGKTILNLEKALGLHAQNYGFKSAVLRHDSVDLQNTIRNDLTNIMLRYGFSDPRSQIRASGGERFHTLHLNGGVMVLSGARRPTSVMGTHWDLMILSEFSEFTEEQFQLLKTRCSGSAGNWRGPNGEVYYQMLCDMNPTLPNSYIYKREASGQMEFVKLGFKDNPYFYRQGRWSIFGKTTINEYDTGLTGIYRDRYLLGLRTALEGAVFKLEDCHFVDKLPEVGDEWKIYRRMDLGMSPSPSVCLWLLENRLTNDVIVAKEWRKLNTDTIDMSDAVKTHDFGKPMNTITDNDKNAISIFRKNGIPAIAAVKGPDSIKLGNALINAALENTRKGKPGGLKFYTGLRCNSDQDLIQKKRPLSTIKEMEDLVYDVDVERVIGERHGIDPLRYHYLAKETFKQRFYLDPESA